MSAEPRKPRKRGKPGCCRGCDTSWNAPGAEGMCRRCRACLACCGKAHVYHSCKATWDAMELGKRERSARAYEAYWLSVDAGRQKR